MRLRFSIGWLMVVVVLAAFDFGVMRWVEPLGGPLVTDAAMELAITTPITLNILGVAGFVMIRSLVRHGECGPFLAGFLVTGTLAMIVVTACTMCSPIRFLSPSMP